MAQRPQLKQNITKRLKGLVKKNYDKDFKLIDVIIPDGSMSKINIHELKRYENISSFDFKPDILGILVKKSNEEVNFIFINISESSISLREIGEMQVYNQLANPLFSIIMSPQSISSEVSILLFDDKIKNKLLRYNQTSPIIIATWDDSTQTIIEDETLPIDFKHLIS